MTSITPEQEKAFVAELQALLPSAIECLYEWEQRTKTGFCIESVYVARAGAKGLGVFAKKAFRKGEIIEFCHSIKMDTPRQYLHEPQLSRYCYGTKDYAIMPLGFGAIYNSSATFEESNSGYFIFDRHKVVMFYAARDISIGEEIVTFHGKAYFDSWCSSAN